MLQAAANDDWAIGDPDDAETARHEARRAKIRHKWLGYAGRTDLLDLAIASCIELRREQGELQIFAPKPANDREPHKRRVLVKALLERITMLGEELEAVIEAMDEATKSQFMAAMDELPSPRELVTER